MVPERVCHPLTPTTSHFPKRVRWCRGAAYHRGWVWQDEGVPTSTDAQPSGRPLTWVERLAERERVRRSPEHLAELADELRTLAVSLGFAKVGYASVEPFLDTRAALIDRVDRGYAADMTFTFAKPVRSTTPAELLPDAATLVVGAWAYHRDEIPTPLDDRLHGRVARYQWRDVYGEMKSAFGEMAKVLRADRWRTRVLADDNVLVDRAAAHRAGLGWYGKNANLLLPQAGSWFVLGSLLTDAPLPTNTEPVADGCGTCVRCLPACPTGAIVAPGVIDGTKCLAWIVQSAGDIPDDLRVAMHDRIYGCDDCQEACPENRRAERTTPSPPASDSDVAVVNLLWLLRAPDTDILAAHGRWYLADRNPDLLRRNAAIALGNVAEPASAEVRHALHEAAERGSAQLARHANWALLRLAHRL